MYAWLGSNPSGSLKHTSAVGAACFAERTSASSRPDAGGGACLPDATTCMQKGCKVSRNVLLASQHMQSIDMKKNCRTVVVWSGAVLLLVPLIHRNRLETNKKRFSSADNQPSSPAIPCRPRLVLVVVVVVVVPVFGHLALCPATLQALWLLLACGFCHSCQLVAL